MARTIIFGEISGIKEGELFKGRKEMMPSSFHRVWGRGIDSDKDKGAAAVVLSGGYKDIDNDDVIIYTGAGGRDKNGKQIEDQKWTHNDNKGLIISCDHGLPVRVIIGHKHKSPMSPKVGYVYAGLYYVESYWTELETLGDKEFKMHDIVFKICQCYGPIHRQLPGAAAHPWPAQLDLGVGRVM